MIFLAPQKTACRITPAPPRPSDFGRHSMARHKNAPLAPPRSFDLRRPPQEKPGDRTALNIKLSKKTATGILILLVITLALPNLCYAQWPVNQQGHALDANPRIGSMGINPNANLDALIPRINLYITGNISGGRSFQGPIPYKDINEFRSNLGSSLLGNFRRDSIGQLNLSSGIAPPQPFFDLSRSTTGTRGGRVFNPSQAYQSTKNPLRTQEPGTLNYINQGTSLPALDRSASSLPSGSRGLTGLAGLSYPIDAAQLVGLDEIPLEQRYQSQDKNFLDRIQPVNNLLQPADLRIKSQTNTDNQESAARANLLLPTDPDAFLPGYQSKPPNYQTGSLNSSSSTWPSVLNRSVSSGSGLTDAPPSAGQTRFTKPYQMNRQLLISPPLTTGRSGVGFLPPTGNISTKSTTTSFGPTRPGNYLALGEQLMKQGKYYHAADAFEKAAIHDSAGPAALLARAHALFAAGEFISSAHSLNQALVQNPKLLETKIDLLDLLGDAKKLQRRLTELDRLQKQSQNPALLFLHGYVLFSNGDLAQAKTALNTAPNSPPFITAIDYLLKAIKHPENIQ
jgi:tetratricopeptide (TPR) repeat protein